VGNVCFSLGPAVVEHGEDELLRERERHEDELLRERERFLPAASLRAAPMDGLSLIDVSGEARLAPALPSFLPSICCDRLLICRTFFVACHRSCEEPHGARVQRSKSPRTSIRTQLASYTRCLKVFSFCTLIPAQVCAVFHDHG
jgi:hypothetical protein